MEESITYADPLEQFRKEWKQELTSNAKEDNLPETTVNKLEKKSYSPVSHVGQSQLPGCSLHNDDITVSANEPNSLKTREESGNIIATCYQQPESCYYSFSIVGKLLNSQHSELSPPGNVHRKQDCDTDKRKRISDSKMKTYKKVKFDDLKYIFSERQGKRETVSNERLLDKLISDIDEITEIPFFDISVPREVAIKIFQYLGIKDLCHCGQVSKSWRSLAEDELLWCRICHRLGQETLYTTREKKNWKQIVQHNIQRQRLLVTNWKSRTGKLSQLEYVKGNILCAVHSYADIIVAGYTNGEVKLWDLASESSCVFQPSSTSLIVNEDSTENNLVQSLQTAGAVSAAAYTQGNVDIWSLDLGTQPIQTHTPGTRRQRQAPSVCLSKGGHCIAIRYGSHLDLLTWNREFETFALTTTLDNSLQIEHAQFLDTDTDSPAVIYSDRNIVHLYHPGAPLSSDSDCQISEIHNLIDAPIHTIDCRPEEALLAVAHGSFFNLADGCKIKLYDIHSGRLAHTLQARALRVTCMNLAESPPNQLVIGTGDRKVHMFDLRIPEPAQTYARHSGALVGVQMDSWKVVSGAWDGFVCVWDRRMNTLLWDMHNRHPVGYSHFSDKHLIVGNVPTSRFPEDEYENTTHKRYRGSVNCYNFLADLTTQDVPEICLSSYDQPDASKYNISLAVPYDILSF